LVSILLDRRRRNSPIFGVLVSAPVKEHVLGDGALLVSSGPRPSPFCLPGHRALALDGSLSPRSDNPSRTEKVDSRALQKLISVALWKYCSNQALSPEIPHQNGDEKADRKNVNGVHRLRPPEPTVSSLWPRRRNAARRP